MMKYFKYWVVRPTDPVNESDCMYVMAPTQDEGTRITEKKYPVMTHLHVREISEADLPEGSKWEGA